MPNNSPITDWWRASFRPLAPGETDGEWLWALLLPAMGLLVAAWWFLGLPTPKCALHEWTGIPCATCGTTRALGALVSGDWGSALHWNPLAVIGAIGAVVVWVYSMIVCLARLPRFRPSLTRGQSRALRVGIVAGIAVNWIYLIATLP